MNCLKNNRGLSLIEIMVALSILAVVGAIAVPQFQNYRKSAAYSALGQSVRNTQRAFSLCRATNAFESCDTMSEINMPKLGGTQPGESQGSNKWCADGKIKISGEDVNTCIEFAGSGNPVITSNRKYCYTPQTGDNCTAGRDKNAQADTSKPACNEDLKFAGGPCLDDSVCDGRVSGDKCDSATANGTCSAGVCS